MDFKIVKLPHNDFNLIQKKHIAELEAHDTNFGRYKDIIFSNNKTALLVHENGSKVGYVLYKMELLSITITSIYVEPTLRGYGYEEVMITSLSNYFKKPFSILVRLDDSYLADIMKKMGFFTTQSPNRKLNELFYVYTKDYNKVIPYTKIMINVDTLYDTETKDYNTAKRILKLYGVKPNKYNISDFLRSIDSVIDDYNNKKLTDEEFFKLKYQRYFKPLGINIDPLLCMRINNSTKVKYKKGIKKFLTRVGKRKHIIVISSIHTDSLKLIRSQLKFPNISKYYEIEVINYSEIKKIIGEIRYRNIEEICYIAEDNIDPFILRFGIDTFLVSNNKISNEDFIFTRASHSISEIGKYIIKK